jgi:hypothetical protein
MTRHLQTSLNEAGHAAHGIVLSLSHPETRVHRAAQDLAETGTPIRHLRSIFVPQDETCFHLFEAPSAEAVREAAQRARLAPQRIVEALP